MRFKEMTLEQLKDVERELLEEEDNYSLQVSLYEEMYRKILLLSRKDKEKYSAHLEGVKGLLIKYLVKYGAYLKMVYQKDDYTAEKSLQKVFKYDKENPIVHYRLGFLAYKKSDYKAASSYFYDSLEYNHFYKIKKYQLNNKQKYYAHMYLTNSALHLAASSYKGLEKLSLNKEIDNLPNLEISPFYHYLSQNDSYMEQNAFYQVTGNEKKTCSKEACEDLFDENPLNTMILYFQDRCPQLVFNDKKYFFECGVRGEATIPSSKKWSGGSCNENIYEGFF